MDAPFRDQMKIGQKLRNLLLTSVAYEITALTQKIVLEAWHLIIALAFHLHFSLQYLASCSKFISIRFLSSSTHLISLLSLNPIPYHFKTFFLQIVAHKKEKKTQREDLFFLPFPLLFLNLAFWSHS